MAKMKFVLLLHTGLALPLLSYCFVFVNLKNDLECLEGPKVAPMPPPSISCHSVITPTLRSQGQAPRALSAGGPGVASSFWRSQVNSNNSVTQSTGKVKPGQRPEAWRASLPHSRSPIHSQRGGPRGHWGAWSPWGLREREADSGLACRVQPYDPTLYHRYDRPIRDIIFVYMKSIFV